MEKGHRSTWKSRKLAGKYMLLAGEYIFLAESIMITYV